MQTHHGITFLPYKWRRKTYKTVDGLCNAAIKAHPGCGVSFDKNKMYLTQYGTGKREVIATYAVERTPEASIIADQPIEEVAHG